MMKWIICLAISIHYILSIKGQADVKNQARRSQVVIMKYGWFRCGGVLVSSNTVLTVARCVQDGWADDYSVLFGEDDFSKAKAKKRRSAVSAIELHPDYNQDTLENDIAKLILSEPIEADEKFGPIELARRIFDVTESSECYSLGFGMARSIKSFGQTYFRVSIREPGRITTSRMSVISDKDCLRSLSSSKDTNICIRSFNSGAGCMVDNGAPLMCRQGDRFILAGLRSFGALMCTLPTSYTEVYKYLSWIDIRPSNAVWPWYVAILKNDFVKCTGILVSPKTVLTASHCVDGDSASDLKVEQVEGVVSTEKEKYQRSDVVKVQKHPRYQPASLENDLALLTLKNKIADKETLEEIPLASEPVNHDEISECYTMGFGLSRAIMSGGAVYFRAATRTPSGILQSKVKVMPDSQCPSSLPDSKESNICMIPVDGGSSCASDSGAPLVCSQEGEFVITGVRSFGAFSCDSTTAFTDISKHLSWIKPETLKNKWPWYAALMRGDSVICGGALIDPSTIVTAAHCVEEDDGHDLSVRLGVSDLNGGSDEQKADVANVVVHHAYQPESISDDIAILTLSEPIVENNNVQSIDLDVGQHPGLIKECFVMGFGVSRTAFITGETVPESSPRRILDKLQTSQMSIEEDRDVCSESLPSLPKSSICVAPVDHPGICIGDSGGPIVCGRNGTFVLSGVKSLGSRNCSGPSVYTKIRDFLTWLHFYSHAIGKIIFPDLRHDPGSGKLDFNVTVVSTTNARPGDYPWHVSVIFDDVIVCGGALIDKNKVVTAAHCVDGYRPRNFTVLLGETNFCRSRAMEEVIFVSDVVVHPDFNATTGENNIAILILSQNAELNGVVEPISLATPQFTYGNASSCYMTGYGMSRFLKKKGAMRDFRVSIGNPNMLRRINVTELPDSQCEQLIDIVPESDVCVFAPYRDDAICFGDSGGPLVCEEEDGHPILFGTASFGMERCDGPRVHTEIGYYLEWIQSEFRKHCLTCQ